MGGDVRWTAVVILVGLVAMTPSLRNWFGAARGGGAAADGRRVDGPGPVAGGDASRDRPLACAVGWNGAATGIALTVVGSSSC
ncbi:MAG: hypothetical protein R2695_03450 [Acidimicrobiales bacterium]